MGFDRRRSRDSSQSTEAGNDTRVWGQDEFPFGQSSDDDLPGPNPSVRGGFERAEEYYGREFDDHKNITRIRRLEKNHGEDVHDWIDEGVPIDAMGDPDKMEAYRERKGTPIPWDIEQQNKDSKEWNKSEVARKMRETPDGYARVTDSVRDVLSSPGRPLDEPIQRAMEERMGDSFGDVQIHAGPKAAEAAEQINARAFTVGNHIAFNHGEYDPSSAEGQRVIAHELAHVRQQTGGALSMLPQEDLQLEIDPDPELEREAEETAERVMSGGELDIQRLPLRYADVHVQRLWKLGGSDSDSGGEAEAETGDQPAIEQFQGGDLDETIGTLIRNQQKLAEAVGVATSGGGSTGPGEMAAQETVKASTGEAAKQVTPEDTEAAADAVPTSLEEAEQYLTDALDLSAETATTAIQAGKELEPSEVVPLVIDGVEGGATAVLELALNIAPMVAGALAVGIALKRYGSVGSIPKNVKQKPAEMLSYIKSHLSGEESERQVDSSDLEGASEKR